MVTGLLPMNSQNNIAASVPQGKRPRSLRIRLFWITVGGMALTLLLTNLALTTLFKEHVVTQFQTALARQLDQLLVQFEFDATGKPMVAATDILDPRQQKQYSGFYWQIDKFPVGAPPTIGILRSRSLWDTNLSLPFETLPSPGKLVVSETIGPAKESLLVLQRIISSVDAPGDSFRLIVAGDLRYNLEATKRFARALTLVQLVLFLLLVLSAWAQVSIGLKPLRDLQQALKAVRNGDSPQLEGRFPQEVQPLVNDFNHVLLANAATVERARTHAGNLAHALKTPLAILENETELALNIHEKFPDTKMVPADLIKEQLAQIRRHIDWHLMRARVAAMHTSPTQQTDVAATLSSLLRVLNRVFADKQIQASMQSPDQPLFFAGEEQDLQEILGNVLENAFKWAHSSVTVTVSRSAQPSHLEVLIEDDGPGIDISRLQTVLLRGVRLDETTPGSGLGLAIVQDLVQLYSGELNLSNATEGRGFRARICLPRGREA